MPAFALRASARTIIAAGLTMIVLSAQEPAPAQLEPFRTEVNYIRVDMYPTAGDKPVLDLTADDVEILDEGVPQTIDRFEHVLVRGARSQDMRHEPSSLTEMREAMQDVRARLFVLFLDTEHVEFGPSLSIRGPLIQSLNEMIGGDDLIALMTADMEARDIIFRRRTTSIEGLLRSFWSERDYRLKKNPEEERIKDCFGRGDPATDEMIFRLREVRTLDALESLVQRLRFVREERKAVIAITQGWRLYSDDPTVQRPAGGGAPVPGVGRQKCDRPQLSLSMLRNDLRFLDILRQANTGNTSFYPVDPRGLVVFDEDIAPISPSGHWSPMLGVVEDSRRLQARNDSLRTMAEVTDGIAVVQTGNLSAGMRRIVEDLSSYYLIGYYSTTDMDGKFHRLTVRTKRPGVRVRARTGYLAATRGDHEKARAAAMASAAVKPVDLHAKAVEQSLSSLAIFSRERPLRVLAAAGYLPSGSAVIHAVAEVPATSARHDWSDGGQADVTLIDSRRRTVATERLTIAPGSRTLRFTIGARAALAPGDYQLRVRAKGASAPLGALETVRIPLQPPPAATGAMVVRRGVTTGNQPMPTADLRFRRTEQVIVEVPTTTNDAGTAQLLDRSGKPMAIPVATTVRQDAEGTRWRTAQLGLAPLAAGDYVIETAAGSEKSLVAIRVLP